MKTKAKQWLVGLLLTAVVVTMLAATNSIDAQIQRRSIMTNRVTQSGWRVYSPPNKSFTVELPREPRRTNKLDPTSSDEESFFECTKSVDAYELQLRPKSPEYAFVIGVFDVSACQRKPETFNEEVEGLVAVIGGDNKRLLSDSKVNVDGLSGREFMYENGDLHGRVLIVNAGKRIYFLTYTTDIPGGTSSPEATRMFKTFHPVKQ